MFSNVFWCVWCIVYNESADPPVERVDPSSFFPSFCFSFILSFLQEFSEPPTPRGEVYLPLIPLLGPGSESPDSPRASSRPIFFDLISYIQFLWHFGNPLAPKGSKMYSKTHENVSQNSNKIKYKIGMLKITNFMNLPPEHGFSKSQKPCSCVGAVYIYPNQVDPDKYPNMYK